MTTKTPAKAPPPAFAFTYPAREIIEQVNLQIPGELGYVRQAVSACFHALNDPGGNNPTTVTVQLGDGSVTIAVAQTPYVHG